METKATPVLKRRQRQLVMMGAEIRGTQPSPDSKFKTRTICCIHYDLLFSETVTKFQDQTKVYVQTLHYFMKIQGMAAVKDTFILSKRVY